MRGEEFETEVFELVFLYFPAAGEGEAFHEKYVFRNFVTGDFSFAEIFYIGFVEGFALFEYDECADLFAVFARRHRRHLHVFDLGHFVEEFLYFAGIDVFAAAYDHVFYATGDFEIAFGCFHAQVAGVEIAVAVDDFGGGFGHFVIPFHDVVAFAAHFALYADGTLFEGFGVDDFHVDFGQGASYGGGAHFHRVVHAALSHAGRSFGKSVHAGDFGHVHFIHDFAHQPFGAERACHDAGAQRREVEHGEHRVVELGDEHRGHAVEGGAPLAVYGGEHHEGVEFFEHHGAGAVGDDCHDAQHDAEAVEQGHGQAHAVLFGELHALSDAVAVVGDVVVGEHDAFGKSRRAGGVLHIHHLVAIEFPAAGVELLVGAGLPEQQQFGGVVHTPMFLLPDVDDVAQIGEACAVQVAALRGAQLGHHGVGHIHVIAFGGAVGDAERVQVGIIDEVFQLVLFVVGIDGYQHRAYLGGGEKKRKPVGHVGCPDAHMRAGRYAYGEQAFCQLIDPPVELPVGEPQVAVGIDDELLVGRAFRPIFEPFAQSFFKQLHRRVILWLCGYINDSQNSGCPIAVGVYVVGYDGVVIDALALPQYIAAVAVGNLHAAFRYENELLAFVRRKFVVIDGDGGDVDDERLHVAVGFGARQRMVIHVRGRVRRVGREGDACRAHIRERRTQVVVVVEESAQTHAHGAGYFQQYGEGGQVGVGFYAGELFDADAGLFGKLFAREIFLFAVCTYPFPYGTSSVFHFRDELIQPQKYDFSY